MEYNNFEELYKDNREIIDLEFKKRLINVLNKLLSKINSFQEKEHKEIDGGASYIENKVHRDNIVKLEEVYKPLYNYINNTSLPLITAHRSLLDEIKQSFIELLFPDINGENRDKMRGKPHWHEDYIKACHRAYNASIALDGILNNVYLLGATNIDSPENKSFEINSKEREVRLHRLLSYGKDTSLSKMVTSLFDLGTKTGYEEAVKKGLKKDEIDNYAYENGMKVATDFIKDIFIS